MARAFFATKHDEVQLMTWNEVERWSLQCQKPISGFWHLWWFSSFDKDGWQSSKLSASLRLFLGYVLRIFKYILTWCHYSDEFLQELHVTYRRLSAATAWLHQTGANRCPDSSTECKTAQDKHAGKNGHLSTIAVFFCCYPITVVVIFLLVVGMISSEVRNRNTVKYDDNSAQYSWGNRKPHEHTSLKNVINANKQHSTHNQVVHLHKVRYLEGKVNNKKSILLQRP